ncbi:MAG: response regulator [Prochlorotrichaceae cyanobacterium]|jgi:anaerobic magnesium-protoporphyrin IX monomethyl ester cyclase
MNDIQTIVVETDEQTRVALRMALRSQPGIEVACEATNGTTGLVLLESIDVDVAIVDMALPDMSIEEFTQQMRDLQEDGGVTRSHLLILLNPPNCQHFADVWALQASGYICKNAPIEEMADAIRQIYSGKQYVDPSIAQLFPEAFSVPMPFNEMGAFI